jgi:phage-related protein
MGVITSLVRGLGPIVQATVGLILKIVLALATLVVDIVLAIASTVQPIIEGTFNFIVDSITMVGSALEVLVGWFKTAFDAIANIIAPVADSVSKVIDTIGKVKGGTSSLMLVAKAAPRASAAGATASGGGTTVGGASNSTSIGQLSVSIGGSTNMGASEIQRNTREGVLQAMQDAQLRAAARGLG